MRMLDISQVVALHTYLGLAWLAGCLLLGGLVASNTSQCSVSRQYLCQSSLLLAAVILFGLSQVNNYQGYVMFGKYDHFITSSLRHHCSLFFLVCSYGVVVGGYQYTVKMFVFEKVRSKRFPWAWSLLQSIQAAFFGLGVLMNALIDSSFGSKTSIYVCIVLVIISSVVMFLIDVCKGEVQLENIRILWTNP